MSEPANEARRLELPFLSALKWTPDGLVPAIVQDAGSGEVLMLAWMDEAAIRQTLATGQTHFYSRSRKSAWHKGGTSGPLQHPHPTRAHSAAPLPPLPPPPARGPRPH